MISFLKNKIKSVNLEESLRTKNKRHSKRQRLMKIKLQVFHIKNPG